MFTIAMRQICVVRAWHLGGVQCTDCIGQVDRALDCQKVQALEHTADPNLVLSASQQVVLALSLS